MEDPADLGTAEWQAKVARFILGSANRPARLRDTAVGGCGYMLLGVEPGTIEHTPMPDAAALDNGIRRFIGPTGPLWSPTPLTIEGQQIVAVTVEPGEPGRQPYLARRDFQGNRGGFPLRSGRTYIRRLGATEEATAEEMDEILEEVRRSAISIGPPWMLRLKAEAEPLTPVDYSEQAIEAWLESERDALTRGFLDPANPVVGIMPFQAADKRTRAEYQQEVDEWLPKARRRVGGSLIRSLAGAKMNSIYLDAHNDGEENLPELEVSVRLPPGAVGIGRTADLRRTDCLPVRPRRPGDIFGSVAYDSAFLSVVPPSGVHSRTIDGQCWLLLPRVEVRPHGMTERQRVFVR